MTVLERIFAEASEQGTAYLVAGVLLLVLLARWRPAMKRRLPTLAFLLVLHAASTAAAGILGAAAPGLHDGFRTAAAMFAVLVAVGLSARLLFKGFLPVLGLPVPQILEDVVVAVASIIAVLVVATRQGMNISGVIATSTVLTAVVGLALQDTLSNILAGLSLQSERSVAVGDWVKVGDVTGRVSEIRWRYTAVETRNWETVILPNTVLSRSQVIVLGRREGQPLQLRRWIWFNVDYRFSAADVIAAVTEAMLAAAIEGVAADPAPSCLLMDFQESSGRYAVRYWLTDIDRDDPTDSLVRIRIHYALKRASIPLSIPAQAVFLTEESEERRERKRGEDLEHRLRALEHIDFFRQLPEPERLQLARSLRYAPFGRGETLTKQGAEAHWLYLITAGEASVHVSVEGGLENEVGRLHAGQFFGEMGLMTGEPRTATVLALSDVECYRLDKAAFQAILHARPELVHSVAELLAKRRVELLSVREGLDHEALRLHVAEHTHDLLGRIRAFFGLAA